MMRSEREVGCDGDGMKGGVTCRVSGWVATGGVRLTIAECGKLCTDSNQPLGTPHSCGPLEFVVAMIILLLSVNRPVRPFSHAQVTTSKGDHPLEDSFEKYKRIQGCACHSAAGSYRPV